MKLRFLLVSLICFPIIALSDITSTGTTMGGAEATNPNAMPGQPSVQSQQNMLNDAPPPPSKSEQMLQERENPTQNIAPESNTQIEEPMTQPTQPNNY